MYSDFARSVNSSTHYCISMIYTAEHVAIISKGYLFRRIVSIVLVPLHNLLLKTNDTCFQEDFLLITEVVEGGSLHHLIHSSPHTKLQHSVVLQFAAQVTLYACNTSALRYEVGDNQNGFD